MKINYPHNLTPEEAYRRIDAQLSSLQATYAPRIRNPQVRWNPEHTHLDFNVEIMGFGTEGQVILSENQVSLEGKVPLLTRMFSGKIEEIIRKQLEELFS